MTRRHFSTKGLLMLLNDVSEVVLPPGSHREVMNRLYQSKNISLGNYFPSEVKRVTNRLERSGVVEKRETKDGWVIKITQKGKKEILRLKLEDIKPKRDQWDGLWRVVFFDIEEVHKSKRNTLRKFLQRLGMQQMQESVFISPFKIEDEVKSLREILEIPHAVKIGVLQSIENADELKEIFEIG